MKYNGFKFLGFGQESVVMTELGDCYCMMEISSLCIKWLRWEVWSTCLGSGQPSGHAIHQWTAVILSVLSYYPSHGLVFSAVKINSTGTVAQLLLTPLVSLF